MALVLHRALALSLLVGCSSATGGTQGDGGADLARTDARSAPVDGGGRASVSDAAARDATARDATARDAGTRDSGTRDAGARDAGASDAGPAVETRCFEDVELGMLRGGREILEPIGIFEHDRGWVVAYSASAHDGTDGRFAAFLDREGRVTATQTLGSEDVYSAHAQLGPFVLSWLYEHVALHEIRESEIIARPDLADLLPVAHIVSVEQESDRLRILSATRIDPNAGNFQFAYSELVLDDDGELALRSGALPAVETLGSPGLIAGLTRFHAPVSLVTYGDTLLFAFPTGERAGSVDGDAWNVMRVALDRSGLESGTVGWSLADERRWEDGPSSVFGGFPELDLVVAGRFRPSKPAGYWPVISVERFVDPADFRPVPLNTLDDGSMRTLGPARVMRRGDRFALHIPGLFGVFALPSGEGQASASLELTSSYAHWGDDEVLELGGARNAEGLAALVRCHEPRAR